MNSLDSASADLIPPDMRDALGKFDSQAKQIVDSTLGPLDSHEPPRLIYHYTNDLGLKGILETGTVWLTDIFSLNDPSELSYGLSHAVKILDSKGANGPRESKDFARVFKAFAERGGIRHSAHYFICCFSSCGDDLGQWRAYADNGRGYALGFDGKALKDVFDKEGEGPLLRRSFPIRYEAAELVKVHGKLIESMFDLISLPQGRNSDVAACKDYKAWLLTLLAAYAVHAAAYFKHEAYSNEREYRFLELHRAEHRASPAGYAPTLGKPLEPPGVKRRFRRYSLIRYMEFDWKSASARLLKEIVVGPAADYEKASQFACDCLNSFHTEDVKIAGSEIPYRAVDSASAGRLTDPP